MGLNPGFGLQAGQDMPGPAEEHGPRSLVGAREIYFPLPSREQLVDGVASSLEFRSDGSLEGPVPARLGRRHPSPHSGRQAHHDEEKDRKGLHSNERTLRPHNACPSRIPQDQHAGNHRTLRRTC